MKKLKSNLYKFKVTRTAHVHTLGDLELADHVIFALHGYGQLASRLIQKFNHLDNCFVIAPEGLSSFYWNGVQGEVVASWMTSHHREDEINDYLNYLNKVFTSYKSQMKGKSIHLFGFSQGCATLWRWLEAHKPDIKTICLWAGWLPEDVNYKHISAYLNSLDIRFIVGKQDEYLTEDRMAVFNKRVEEEKLNLTYLSYDGKHKVERSVLKQWYKSLYSDYSDSN